MKFETKFLIGVGLIGGVLAWAFSAKGGIANTHTVTLVPGQTIILRASEGDLITVMAPSGWGVPSVASNVPGFLSIESASPEAETSVFKVTSSGAGQISMTGPSGEVAVLSIDVL